MISSMPSCIFVHLADDEGESIQAVTASSGRPGTTPNSSLGMKVAEVGGRNVNFFLTKKNRLFANFAPDSCLFFWLYFLFISKGFFVLLCF